MKGFLLIFLSVLAVTLRYGRALVRPPGYQRTFFSTYDFVRSRKNTPLDAIGGKGKSGGALPSPSRQYVKDLKRGSKKFKNKKERLSAELRDFPEKINSLADNAMLLKFLRAVAHKKVVVAGGDAKALLKSLSKRLPSMTVSHVAETLWIIGTLRLRRTSEMLKVMDLALERLDLSRDFLTGKDVTTALVGMARLSIVIRIYPGHFLSALGGSRGLSVMTPHEVASCTWALGKVGASWDSFPFQLRKAASDGIARTLPEMKPQGVANTIYGLSLLRTEWKILPPVLRDTLLFNLQRTVSGMKEMEISNSLSGLGRLSCDWSSLPPTLRDSIGSAFLRVSKDLGNQGLTQHVHGLGRMNTEFASLPEKVQDGLIGKIKKLSGDLNDQEIANLIYGLGKMGCTFGERSTGNSRSGRKEDRFVLPVKVQQCIIDALSKQSWMMTAQGISNSMWGLMLMGAQWRHIPSNAQHAIVRTIERQAPRMDEQIVANIAYSLGRMDCTWTSLPPRAQKAFVLAIEVHASEDMAPSGAIMTLLGLGRMELHWTKLSSKSRLAISESIKRVLSLGYIRSTGNIIHALASMGARWDTIPASLRTNIEEGISRSHWAMNRADKRDVHKDADLGVDEHKTCVDGDEQEQGEEEEEEEREWSIRKLIDLEPTSAAAMLLLDAPRSRPDVPSTKDQQLDVGSLVDALATFDVTQRRTMGLGLSSGQQQGSSPVLEALSPSSISKKGDEMKKYDERQGKSSRKEVVSTSNRMKHVRAFEHFDRHAGGVGRKGTSEEEPHLVQSLGEMGAPFDSFGYSTRTSLINSLTMYLKTSSEKGTVNALSALTKLGLQWTDLDTGLRIAVEAALVRVAPDMAEQGVSMTVLSLAKMRMNLNEGGISDATKATLRAAILRQARLSEHALSNLLYGLGKMTTWSLLHPDLRHSLKQAIVVCHLTERCTPQGVSNGLHGLAEMLVPWHSLSTSVRLALTNDAHKVLESATTSQLANILWSFAKLGVRWDNDISSDLQSDILLCLDRHLLRRKSAYHGGLTERHLSNILYALGGMGVRWDSLPSDLRRGLEKALVQVNQYRPVKLPASQLRSNVAPQGRSSMVDLAYTVNTAACSRTNNDSAELMGQSTFNGTVIGTQGLSMTIVGLGRMGASFTSLAPSLTNTLKRSISKLHGVMHAGQLSALISGLSKLDCRWDNMKLPLQRAVLGSIMRTIREMSPQEVSMTLCGMGQLGVRWEEDLSRAQRSSIMYAVSNTGKCAEPVEVAGMVFGLGVMDCKWDRLPSKFRKTLVSVILRVATEKNSDYGRADRPGSSVDDEDSFWLMSIQGERRLNTKRMCPQATANIMYALSLLVFDTADPHDVYLELKPVHLALLEQVSRLGPLNFSEGEKEQMQIYTYMLQTFVPQDGLDADHTRCLFRADIEVERRGTVAQSRLQRRVVEALTQALKVTQPTTGDPKEVAPGLQVVNEYSPFGGAVPVDATIFGPDGKPVCFLEVDGPHHYPRRARDGAFVLRRKDEMKEALYKRVFRCSFLRVRYDQVSVYGEAYIGKELANFINILRTRCGHDDTYYDTHTEHDFHESCHSDGIVTRRAHIELMAALRLPKRPIFPNKTKETDLSGLRLWMYRSSHLCES